MITTLVTAPPPGVAVTETVLETIEHWSPVGVITKLVNVAAALLPITKKPGNEVEAGAVEVNEVAVEVIATPPTIL